MQYAEKELKKELAQVRDFLLSLIANLPAGVIVVDLNGIVIAANERVCELLRLKKRINEIMDKSIYDMKDACPAALLNELKKDTRTAFEVPAIEIPPDDGKRRFVRIDGKPIVGGMLIMVEDITPMKLADELKNEFISIASHQLRTPLVGMQWVIERIDKKEKLSEKGREYMHDMHGAIVRLAGLVDTLLNVSRIEEGSVAIKPEKIAAVSFVQRVLDEFKPLCAKKKVTCRFTSGDEEIAAETDKSAFRNIVQSLISNAIEYNREGGSVTVSLEKKPETFTLSVEDTGIGVPRAEQDRLFQKFFRAKNATEYKTDGTGLGLYIVKEAVRLLGGEIRFTSQENEGTTFSVELPLQSKVVKGNKKLT